MGPAAIQLKSPVPGIADENRSRRDFVVLLVADTGQLFSVKSTFNGLDANLRPEPSAASAEGQLVNRSSSLAGSAGCMRSFARRLRIGRVR